MPPPANGNGGGNGHANGNGVAAVNGRAKLLIVEDAEQQRDLFERVVATYLGDRVQVFKVDSRKAALTMHRTRGPFALVLLDLDLPDSKPEDTMECGALFGCPWLAISGVGGDELRKQAYDCGAVDFVEKPVVTEVLIDKISRALERYTDAKGPFAAVQRQAQHELAVRTGRGDNARPSHWLNSTPALVGMIISIIALACTVFTFIWSQAQANALFRQQVTENTQWIQAVGEPGIREAQKTDVRSADDRAAITRRIEGQEAATQEIRRDIQDGFKRIYEILLQERNRNASASATPAPR